MNESYVNNRAQTYCKTCIIRSKWQRWWTVFCENSQKPCIMNDLLSHDYQHDTGKSMWKDLLFYNNSDWYEVPQVFTPDYSNKGTGMYTHFGMEKLVFECQTVLMDEDLSLCKTFDLLFIKGSIYNILTVCTVIIYIIKQQNINQASMRGN